MFELSPLPYNMDALEPYISHETMQYHYGKHHRAYVDNLNKLISGTEFEAMSLEEIIAATAGDERYSAIFNNAGQVYNHNMFWKSMKEEGGEKPSGIMAEKIMRCFGSYENFRQQFKDAAVSLFGSGWVWLAEKDGKLAILKTQNAENPLIKGYEPILCLDVWEHAYYIDYRNRRADFAEVFLAHLINWE